MLGVKGVGRPLVSPFGGCLAKSHPQCSCSSFRVRSDVSVSWTTQFQFEADSVIFGSPVADPVSNSCFVIHSNRLLWEAGLRSCRGRVVSHGIRSFPLCVLLIRVPVTLTLIVTSAHRTCSPPPHSVCVPSSDARFHSPRGGEHTVGRGHLQRWFVTVSQYTNMRSNTFLDRSNLLHLPFL